MATSSSSITSSIAAGAGAGFDITAVIAQLMQIERQPIKAVQVKQNVVQGEISAIGAVKTKLAALQSAASAMAEPTSLDLWRAVSSDEKTATVSAPAGSSAGSLSFYVNRVAGVHSLRSRLTAQSASVSGGATTESRLVVLAGLGQSGIRSVKATTGLSTGALAVAVEQATQAATQTGSSLSSTTTVTAANNTFEVLVNGSTATVTIASGVYSRAGLLSALQTAIQGSSASGSLTADMNGSNQIVLSTVREGSAATLAVTGGTALSDLGLSVSGSPATGVDGVLSVRGAATTVSNTDDGNTVTADAGSGESVVVTLKGGLRVASATGAVVSTGSGSINDVVSAVQSANVGVRAQSVQVGTNQYRLQISATTSGEKAGVAVDPDSFNSLGGMLTAVANTDAKITIGDGTGAYSIESASNQFSQVFGGWNIGVKSQSNTAVTVDVERDTDGVLGRVKSLVQAANEAIAELKKQTVVSTSGAKTTAGVLSRDSTFRSMLTTITSQFVGAGVAGISVGRDGTVKLDETAFKTAYEADPAALSAKLGRSFTSQTGGVGYASATKETRAGTYAVSVTAMATKGVSATSYVGGAGGADTIEVVRGATTVTYAVSAGESAASIALGLQAALDAKSVPLTVETSGGGVRVASQQWGSVGTFKIKFSSSDTQATVSGNDAAGTIDGVAAAGFGQFLSLPTDSTSGAAGLRVSTESSSVGSHSVTYATGLAGAAAYSMTSLLRTGNGTLSLAETTRQTRVRAYTTQMDAMERRAVAKEDQLKKQYSALDSVLGRMKSQLASLSSQLGSLQGNNNS